jgi:predicted transglutaminase-like cysteine proteinase
MTVTMNSWLVALCAGLILSASAEAQPSRIDTLSAIADRQTAVDRDADGAAGKIRLGRPSAVPDGYYTMCVNHPNLCRVRGGRVATARDGSVELTSAMRDRLESVNASVNTTIHPAHSEEWTPGLPVGDCKDFAMTKRQRLIDAGWPTSALPVAIVRTHSGEQHLILVARTTRGDYVLDNLTDGIVPWNRTSYSWEKIQSTTSGMAWHSL